MTDVLFPLLDDEAPETPGVVSTWFAGDGSAVSEGALIAEVQVSKIAGEITAPASGTLRHKVAEGDVVEQRSVIASIE